MEVRGNPIRDRFDITWHLQANGETYRGKLSKKSDGSSSGVGISPVRRAKFSTLIPWFNIRFILNGLGCRREACIMRVGTLVG
jgi:hypothetical protein